MLSYICSAGRSPHVQRMTSFSQLYHPASIRPSRRFLEQCPRIPLHYLRIKSYASLFTQYGIDIPLFVKDLFLYLQLTKEMPHIHSRRRTFRGIIDGQLDSIRTQKSTYYTMTKDRFLREIISVHDSVSSCNPSYLARRYLTIVPMFAFSRPSADRSVTAYEALKLEIELSKLHLFLIGAGQPATPVSTGSKKGGKPHPNKDSPTSAALLEKCKHAKIKYHRFIEQTTNPPQTLLKIYKRFDAALFAVRNSSVDPFRTLRRELDTIALHTNPAPTPTPPAASKSTSRQVGSKRKPAKHRPSPSTDSTADIETSAPVPEAEVRSYPPGSIVAHLTVGYTVDEKLEVTHTGTSERTVTYSRGKRLFTYTGCISGQVELDWQVTHIA